MSVLFDRLSARWWRIPGVGFFCTFLFHQFYYYTHAWERAFWLGIPLQKYPLDLWIYQEILYEVRPNLIIECGTLAGGSALYLACICDLLGEGRVLTIDVEKRPSLPAHPRIRYLTGSSVSPSVVEAVRKEVLERDRVLVILDSDHLKDHVLQEMHAYGSLVSPGSYLIVEDSNLGGHPIQPFYGPGPMEAVHEFLRENAGVYVVDRSREKFYLTANPRGYLRKLPGNSI